MEPYNNTACIPPEKTELFGYYFQIPKDAEVKRVLISTLSSSVQQRITRLGGCTDFTKTPYVIVVSPISKQKFPSSHIARTTAAEAAAEHSLVAFDDTGQSTDGRSSTGKEDKWMMKDPGTYLVPVKCLKDTALTILQLSQASNEEKSSLKSELSKVSDSLVLNLQVVEMKATALCMYKNMMYLLPESKKRSRRDGGRKGQEKAEAESRPEMTENRDRKESDLGCVTLRKFSFLQKQHQEIEVRVSGESETELWTNEAEESTHASPSSRPSTENSLQISFWERSERRIKRKLSYFGNKGTLIKKIHLSGSDVKRDSPAAKNAMTPSPLLPHLPSSGAPPSQGLQESRPSSSGINLPPSVKSAKCEGLSSSSLLCSISPPMFPAPLIPEQSCRDIMSHPWPNAKSSPSLFSKMSEDNHESDENLLCLKPKPSQPLSEFSTGSQDSQELEGRLPYLKPITITPLSGFNESSEDSHEPNESHPCPEPISIPSLSEFRTSSKDSYTPNESYLCPEPMINPSLSVFSTNSDSHESHPCPELMSSPSLSGFCKSPENNHELEKSPPCPETISSPRSSDFSTSSRGSHEPDESHLYLKSMSSPSISELGTRSEFSHELDELCLKPISSPTLSEISASSKDSHEPDEMSSSSEPSQVHDHSRSEHASFPDIDDTTRDERTQRLLDRVRQWEKIVEDMRQQKEKLN